MIDIALSLLILAVSGASAFWGYKSYQEQKISRDKDLIKDILNKEVYRGIDAIEYNREYIKSEDANWIKAADGEFSEGNILKLDLKTLSLRDSDQVVSERFADMYPSVVPQANDHDELLVEIEKLAAKVVQESREPIREYIEYRGVRNSSGDLIHEDEVINYALIGDKPAKYGERPDYWEKHAMEVKTIIYSHAPEAYEKFRDKNMKYFNRTLDLKEEYNEIRRELEKQYGIGESV